MLLKIDNRLIEQEIIDEKIIDFKQNCFSTSQTALTELSLENNEKTHTPSPSEEGNREVN